MQCVCVAVAIAAATVAVTLPLNAAAVAAAAPLSTLDWTVVPATADAAAARTFTQSDVGSCMCDLTVGACDANCCCDPDCAGESSGTFTECGRAAAATAGVMRCAQLGQATEIMYKRDELQEVHPLGADSICIMYQNGGHGLDDFWKVPSQAAALAALPAHTTAWPAASVGTGYQVGDGLSVVDIRESSGAWVMTVPPGEATLTGFQPAPDAAGTCDADATVRFLQNIPAAACRPTPLSASVAAQCQSGGALDLGQWIYRAITAPGANLALTSSIAAVQVRVYDDATGSLMDAVDAKVPLGLATGALTAGTVIGPAVNTTWSGTACLNAVVSTALYVVYAPGTAGSTVTEAFVLLRIANVTDGVVPTQARSVTFLRSGTDAAAAIAANTTYPTTAPLVGRADTTRSGHPGYARAAPLRVGFAVDTTVSGMAKQAVRMLEAGLRLPFGGSCSGGGAAGVLFLYDTVDVSCELQLTRAELEAVCASSEGSLPRLRQAVLQAVCADGGDSCLTAAGLSSSAWLPDRIAYAGDSDPVDINEWVPVTGLSDSVAAPQPYDTITQACLGIATGFELTVAVGRGGPIFNPQDLVVAAKLTHTIGSWAFRPTPAAMAALREVAATGTAAEYAAAEAALTTAVRFTFAVRFQRVENAGSKYFRRRSVPPSFLPDVSADVFYPFQRPGATGVDTTSD